MRTHLTSLALRASETVDAGASVGSDAAAAVLTAVLTHRWRRQRTEEESVPSDSVWLNVTGS